MKIQKQGHYIRVFKGKVVVATYNLKSKKIYGATKYFKYLNKFLKEDD